MLWWSLCKLRSWNYATRAVAVEELARFQGARALNALLTALADKDIVVRTKAAKILVEKGDHRGFFVLLDSSDLNQRRRAAVELAARGEPVGIYAVKEMLLGYGFSGMFQAVIDAELKNSEVTKAVTDLLTERCKTASAKFFSSSSSGIAYLAITALKTIGDRSDFVIQALVTAMQSPSRDVADAAEVTLRHLGAAEVVDKVIEEKARTSAKPQSPVGRFPAVPVLETAPQVAANVTDFLQAIMTKQPRFQTYEATLQEWGSTRGIDLKRDVLTEISKVSIPQAQELARIWRVMMWTGASGRHYIEAKNASEQDLAKLQEQEGLRIQRKKDWRDCWTYPNVVAEPGRLSASGVEAEIKRVVDQLGVATVEQFTEAFYKVIEEQGIPDERKRWIKGPSDSVVKWAASKVSAASRKPSFTTWAVERSSSTSFPPNLPVAWIRIHREGEFSFCYIGKSDEGDACALDAFHPKFF